MSKSYKILSANEHGKIAVLFEEDGVQFRCSYYLPFKEDGSAYTAAEIDDFLEQVWPAGELEAKRQAADVAKDPFASARDMAIGKTPRDMTGRLAEKPDFGRGQP